MTSRTEWRLPLRPCPVESCRSTHTWEFLNPVTMEPFRRGAVVWLCRGQVGR